MKRTLKRELKVPEIAEREANGTSVAWRDCRAHDALVGSCLVCQRQFAIEENSRDMVARLWVGECAWQNSFLNCFFRVWLQCLVRFLA